MEPSQQRNSASRTNERNDFIIRKRALPAWQLLSIFLVCFLALFAIAIYSPLFGSKLAIGLAIFAVIGPLTWFCVYFVQQHRDMLLSTEFQNALFSAAARLKTRFCMIVKQDGTLIYFDHGFQQVFPETANRGVLMIDRIFSTRHISHAEAEKLYRALETGKAEQVIIRLQQTPESEVEKIIVTVDPLPRPQGFFILRGRDFVEKQPMQLSSKPISSQPAPPPSPAMAPVPPLQPTETPIDEKPSPPLFTFNKNADR